MNRRALQIVSLLMLVLMGTAVMHEILPNHSQSGGHDRSDSCALCVLLAITAIVALVAAALPPFSEPAVPLPPSSAFHPASFRRIGHPRSPPLQHR
jgi:hypothetical protein